MKDVALEDIRKVRHEISAECGHDLDRFFAFMLEEQKKYQEQINRYHEVERHNSPAMILNDSPEKPGN